MLSIQTRREFLAALSATCTASVLLGRANAVVQDGPPETTKIRIAKGPPLCWAPEYVADTLLRAEGFVEIENVIMTPADLTPALARGGWIWPCISRPRALSQSMPASPSHC
jgi:hypothetical protein